MTSSLKSWHAENNSAPHVLRARFSRHALNAVSRLNLLRLWPIATDDALTANGRFRGIADMKRFSAPDDL
jgi:hypothetical protein